MFAFVVMVLSEELGAIIVNQLLKLDILKSSLDRLELGNRVARGKKLGWELIVKIHEPSSGVVTAVKQTLSLMNFEEVSMSHTYYGGWTGTLAMWSLKDLHYLFSQSDIGSHPISTQPIGTQIWTKQQKMLYSED